MKKFRLLSWIIIVLLTVSFNHITFANDTLEHLLTLGIAPQGITEQNAGEPITREEFGFMVAKMMNQAVLKPIATQFSDVDETNLYSGYIAYLVSAGIVSGKTEDIFEPKGNVTNAVASKMLVHALGYQELAQYHGGYPQGYVKIASMLGLYKNMNVSDKIVTKNDAITMIDNTFTAEISQPNITNGGVSYENQSDKQTILSDVWGLSVYTGTVTNVNQSAHSLAFLVEGNQYETNKVMLSQGEAVSFQVKSNIDMNAYLYAPVIIWVNDAGEVCDIRLQKNAEILFGCVQSVNKDQSENAAYSVKYINELTLIDFTEDYTVSSTAVMHFNNQATSEPVKLVNRMVRLVIKNNEVTSIESWDLTEGGLITTLKETSIKYIYGDQGDRVLSDLDTYKNIWVYIDGRSGRLSELKVNTVFFYYKNKTDLVIVASERTAVGELMSIGDTEVEIDGFLFGIRDVYYSADGVNYKKNANYNLLYNTMVKAYISPYGKALYISMLDEKAQSRTKIIGFVRAYEQTLLEQDKVCLEIWYLAPETKLEKHYVTKNTKYYDGLNISAVLKSAGRTTEGKVNNEPVRRGIYELELNGAGVITSVKAPTWFYGYGDTAETSISSFVDDSTAMLTLNSKVLFFKNADVTVLYKKSTKYEGLRLNWKELQGRSCGSAQIAFYVFSGNEKSSVPDLVLLHGDGITGLGAQDAKRGVVSGRSLSIDNDTEQYVMITVQTGSATMRYKMTENDAAQIPKYALITYRDEQKFSDSEIAVESMVDLSQSPNAWNVVTGATMGLHRGVVERVDTLRLFTTDANGNSEANFFHPSYNFIIQYNTKNPNQVVSNATIDDINVGDTVFYNLSGDGIKGLIIVK